jgi:hypothetical protein
VEAKAKLEVHVVFQYMAEFETIVLNGRRTQHEVLCRQAGKLAELEAEKAKIKRTIGERKKGNSVLP